MHRVAESFGTRLRLQRERQQLTLATIVAQTKIKSAIFEGLERDDVSCWPSGIFRRAYLRTYAQAVGLEPDAVLREFLELYPDPAEQVDVVSVMTAQIDGAQASAGPPTRLRYLVGSALGSLPLLRTRSTQAPPVSAAVLMADAAPPDVAPPDAASPGASPDVTPPDADRAPVVPTMAEPNYAAAANWCTALSQVVEPCEATVLLGEAARILDASGIIVWVADASASELTPALAYGYSDTVLAHIPPVGRDANNATAAAFRSAQACTVQGNDRGPGALVVPMMTPAGCGGVLAVELQHGAEHLESTRALLTIFAAQLARVPDMFGAAESIERRLA